MENRQIAWKETALKFLKGGEIDVVPFFPDISEWYKDKRLAANQRNKVPTGSFISDDADFHKQGGEKMPAEFAGWTYLDFYRNFNWGLAVHIYHTQWCQFKYDKCEYIEIQERDKIVKQFKTPVGTIEHIDGIAADGSLCPVKHFVRSNEDWKILLYVVEHSHVEANYDYITKVLAGIGQLGIADIVLWRSPFGKIVDEYAGLETTAFMMMDDARFIEELLELQAKKDLEVVKLAADSPADIVILSDHADQQIFNRRWYGQYCVTFYKQAAKILHKNGKIFSTHLDGNFKDLFGLVKQSGFDLLDGCTPAPMTNYEVEELPLALAEGMKAYCGVPSAWFVEDSGISTDQILNFAQRIVKALAGKVILNIGDILPSNGDIYKVIELGKWIAKLSRQKI